VSVASFVAAQRTEHGVPHAVTCRALEVSESWFYKWKDRPSTPRQQRRTHLDAAVRRSFDVSDGDYGSPRVRADLRADGWRVSKKSVEASMARQGLVGRPTRRRFRSLTRPDKAAPPAPDLVKRDFTAPAINVKWCGDLTEIPTDEGKLFLAHVEDLASRRIPGFALSEHHDAAVAVTALQMAAAVHASITRRRRASTRPSSSSCSANDASPPRPRRGWRWPATSTVTTGSVGTAPVR
jgi:putative transposase